MRPVLGSEAIDKPLAGCNADSWLADGVTTILKPGLMAEKLSLRLLKAICEISYFVSIRPDVHSTHLLESVSDCLEALWQDGRLLSHARHNLQHANLWLPILQACKTFASSLMPPFQLKLEIPILKIASMYALLRQFFLLQII